MLYRIMELISKHDTFNLFTEYPSTNNLTTITKKLSHYTNIKALENDILAIFKTVMNAHNYNSIYVAESDRLSNLTRRVFEEAKELKKEEFKVDYTDDVIRLYGESLESFVDGVELVNEHVNFVLR
ncbi:hypothetical protein THOM_2911 [Trachipleistophora hominis]|uniref:Uncharacterized protein n=1 Tax=Trachipleistophora hominis TaxID=72359 RepID=L7JRU5_TRAHO|nr:hypothetical protein THOM_2911 [Trachipleistophora hominis]